jgi:hypothetical protein
VSNASSFVLYNGVSYASSFVSYNGVSNASSFVLYNGVSCFAFCAGQVISWLVRFFVSNCACISFLLNGAVACFYMRGTYIFWLVSFWFAFAESSGRSLPYTPSPTEQSFQMRQKELIPVLLREP